MTSAHNCAEYGMCKTAAFEALVAESDRRGLPRYYLKDLYYYDRNAIEEYKPTYFGWMLRECGTHLFLPHMRDIEWFDAAVKTWPNEPCYWWDGNELLPVTAMELRELLETHI